MSKLLNRYSIITLMIVAIGLGIILSNPSSNDPSTSPPETILLADSKTIQGAEGSYCWGDGDSAVCVDKIPPFDLLKHEGINSTKVSADSVFRFNTIDYPEPSNYSYSIYDADQYYDSGETVIADNGTVGDSFTLDLDNGRYLINSRARWDNGDSSYIFYIEVV